MKMDMTRFISDEDWMCKSVAIVSRAGAAIDEESGERNANAETIKDIYRRVSVSLCYTMSTIDEERGTYCPFAA